MPANGSEPRYVPAAGYAALTPLYDHAIRWTMREPLFRGLLVEQITDGLGSGTVLDLGCGTGTLTAAIAAAAPQARVVGLDGDAAILARARAKAGGGRIEWLEGSATELPFGDRSLDRVSASLLLHHLDDRAKEAALTEAARVLKQGGRLHIADWGRPRGLLMRASFTLLRALDGRANTRLHAEGGLPDAVRLAGFGPVVVTARLRTAWGTLELLAAELSADR